MLSKLFLAFIGLACGITVSGGVFTVFTAVGLVPRFADKTKTANKVMTYENMIILGTFLGLLASVYYDKLLGIRMQLKHAQIPCENIHMQLKNAQMQCANTHIQWANGSILSNIILIIYGLFTGCYIGCLALSIAEIYDSIPIMTRRTHLKKGLGFVILSFAIGKLIGGLLFNSSFKPMT